MNYPLKHPENEGGSTERVKRLRLRSMAAPVTLSIERALIETAFYKENCGKYSIPVLRAKNFYEICAKRTIYIGDDELIVGERGPAPKAVPTFPELTCHSVEDLRTLNARELQSYKISDEDIAVYARDVIPYWKGRTQRERIFSHVGEQWKRAYRAGIFTEFMEQRAAGHTAMDGKMYRLGLLDCKAMIAEELSKLNFIDDATATDRQQELDAMSISCDAAILLAQRHAALCREKAAGESDPRRKSELLKMADVCRWVPAHAPRDFWEAVQMYWFVHLGTITELNGWDSMNPGHLDQHLLPFYKEEERDRSKELLSCLWIKFNNQPAPPKVGVTFKESGTYNDFTNINIGGIDSRGNNAVNSLSYMMLDIQEELHMLQPGLSIHIASNTPDDFLEQGIRVIRQGFGYPSVFNPDIYVKELVRQGKSLTDAREGGCSGCIEAGAFGKEAYLLTGYLNTVKILELTLHDGVDPETGRETGLKTGDAAAFVSFEALYDAWRRQMEYFVNMKIGVNNYIERMFSLYAPATFLSLFIDDCVKRGRDYYDGGARYNTQYIQCTGLGTITDSLSAIKKHVFDDRRYSMRRLIDVLDSDFEGEEVMRQYIINHTPFFGNDDDYADDIAVRVYNDLRRAIEGHPNTRGGKTYMNMLSTTCHNYFGSVCGASANGRKAHFAVSDGTSPDHGDDTHGPTAVIRSLGKLDQTLCGGTLLNMRFLPQLLRRDEDIHKFGQLIREYFKLGGHHIQFNIVDTKTLREAQRDPDLYRDLLVRVAGYSDYFNDLDRQLQNEIIARTENNDL